MEKKIAILAGNLREFNLFAKGNDDYFYVDFEDRVRGMKFRNVLTIGTWYEKKGAYKLLELAKSRIRFKIK